MDFSGGKNCQPWSRNGLMQDYWCIHIKQGSNRDKTGIKQGPDRDFYLFDPFLNTLLSTKVPCLLWKKH
jgi:hypothetical protein